MDNNPNDPEVMAAVNHVNEWLDWSEWALKEMGWNGSEKEDMLMRAFLILESLVSTVLNQDDIPTYRKFIATVALLFERVKTDVPMDAFNNLTFDERVDATIRVSQTHPGDHLTN